MAIKSVMVLGLILVLIGASQLPFTIGSVAANGPIFIKEDGSIEPVSAPIQRNGNTYTLIDDIASFSDGIVVEKNGITVDGAGHTVQGLSNSSASPIVETSGINLTGRSNVTIENTTFIGFANGIMLWASSNNLGGVSSSNTVLGNNLTKNGSGIYLALSSNSYIYGNNITGNIYGIVVASFSDSNSIDGNNLTSNVRGIYLTTAGHNHIQANSVSSTNDGIWLDSSSNNSINFNNSTSNGGYGVILLNSSNYNTILGNDITDNDEGLTLRTSSSYNSIVENNVEGNYRGLEFLDSLNNTVARNNITDSGWFNFRLARCSGNVVYENSITRSFYTLWLDSSSNNSFYHNFMGSLGVFIAPSTHSNVWDDGYPSGGNYWVGSNATDRFSGPYQNATGSDGICDAPLVLDTNDTDHFPLAGPFYSFNATSEQQIQIASNSTISGFRFNGTAIFFDMMGEDKTNGFCRIRIPSDLMNGTFAVFANGTQITYALIPYSSDTFSYLYFSLHFSTQEITVIPEYFYVEMLFVFMLGAALTAFVYKKKH